MKKVLAVVLAASLMLVAACGMTVMADTTPTDVPAELILDANGGTGEMAPVAPVNGKVTIPECTFEKEFYVFDGWNTNVDGSGVSYDAGITIILGDSPLTLYAQWLHQGAVVVEYTVTYDANGGEGETVDIYGPYIAGGFAYTAFNEFTYGDAVFVEWNTAADGSGTSYGEDEMFEINEDVVLYAIWSGVPEVNIGENTGDSVIDDVTNTDAHDPMGSTSATAAAIAAVTALGALVVLKKRG